MDNTKAKSINEYISAQPRELQSRLKELNQAVQQAAPQAQGKISYGMPYYGLNGRLLYFSGFKNHIGFYPMKSAIKEFNKELLGYETSVGTVRFPLDKPLPIDLIKKIVEFRVKENLVKKK